MLVAALHLIYILTINLIVKPYKKSLKIHQRVLLL
jgi:hypothetical protein